MSALRPCNMRGPRLKTLMFLLLLLLTALTRTGLCQDEDGSEEDVTQDETGDLGSVVDGDTETSDPADPDATSSPENPTTVKTDGNPTDEEPEGSGEETPEEIHDPDGTFPPTEDEILNPIIILIPVVLAVVIIGMIVCSIFIKRRWNNKARNQELRKEDPYLDGPSTEKVPMPMFEEDVPSVLELEMEELEWMKKDGDTAEDSKQA
ncbi:transmembrane protein 154 [Labrus mixtus]|uniref:transmembrane protein 154 n=1 Tax=Labrus mixtus TaxID=508554 RepID=UPI0029C0B4CF|nr:transmembrane protein 154 [Labrus mixtus]